MEPDPVGPTVLLELDGETIATLKQAVLRTIGGTDLSALVIVAETNRGTGVFTADWVSPAVVADMISLAYAVVVEGKGT